MTRKDTILIAVVINAGLLTILFTTAVIFDTDKGIEQTEFVSPITDSKLNQSEQPPTLVATASTGDEVDNVLKYYSQPSTQPIVVEIQPETYAPEPIAVQSNGTYEEDVERDSDLSAQERFVEVKVKKGDFLEKIAKANKTTVSAIKNANHLQNERLSIGQVLKIPLKQDLSPFSTTAAVKKQETKLESTKEKESSETLYYVVKSGDNPWKIAKQFSVKYDDILRLNHLDDEKARNLKIGDRIRVK
jgi:peptidoglycan DL-endopeptidase LytF